jgi:hypothetical protein
LPKVLRGPSKIWFSSTACCAVMQLGAAGAVETPQTCIVAFQSHERGSWRTLTPSTLTPPKPRVMQYAIAAAVAELSCAVVKPWPCCTAFLFTIAAHESCVRNCCQSRAGELMS